MIQIGLSHFARTHFLRADYCAVKAQILNFLYKHGRLVPSSPPQTSSRPPIPSTQMSYHPASLVSPAQHSTKLLQLVDMDISRGLIGMYSPDQVYSPVTDLYLAEQLVKATVNVVEFALDIPTSSSRGRSTTRNNKYTEFAQFASDIIERAETTVSDILVALVYIQRSRPYLSVQTEEWAVHRVFLGALITASKYTNDSTLKNIHWAMVSGTFGKRDIGRIEREFIEVLDWDFSVTEADLLLVSESLLHLLPAQHTTAIPVTIEAVEAFTPPSPVNSESSHYSDSSESSSHWSDDDTDSDSHSSPATSPGPLTPSHAVFSPARPRSVTKPIGTVLEVVQHPFWNAPHHPLSVHLVA